MVRIKKRDCNYLSHHGHSATPALRHAAALLCCRLGVLDCLVDGEDNAGGFRSCCDGVDLNKGWFQHAGGKVVGNSLGLNVDAKVGALAGLLCVLLPQLALIGTI